MSDPIAAMLTIIRNGQMVNKTFVCTNMSNTKKAILAVEKNLLNLKKIVEEIYSHLKTYPNGRLIYCGAGTSGRIGVQDGVELYPTFECLGKLENDLPTRHVRMQNNDPEFEGWGS